MWKQSVVGLSVILGCIGGYSFVSGGNLVFSPDVRFVTSVGESVYLDSETLSMTTVVYQSNIDLKNATVSSLCDMSSKFIESTKGLYFFQLDYSNDTSCENGNIVLQLGEDRYANTISTLSLMSDVDMYNIFIDYSSEKLSQYQESVEQQIRDYGIFKNYNKNNISKYFKFFVGQRKYENLVYENNIINHILLGREKKYTSPVPGKTVVEIANKIPNAPRPYRDSYTDGIHHGWDIDGEFGEGVVALDDGIIVRIVDGFDDSDFSRIDYSTDSPQEIELKNLDILRGNQVWLKTLKGEVVFYSHLDFIEGDIQEGMFVERGTPLGAIGISGVPGEGYHDYHLHFAIMMNPYDFLSAGTYDSGDYMSWDWLTRGKTYNEVVEAQKNIFE